jgi:tRNA threonylcarbamoyl adenosine modification protein (Sua5/YciO/YrdC/YwlC family)
MASEVLNIHPVTPQSAKISKVVNALQNGAVILYPTDTGFALGCGLSHKNSIQRIRQIRGIDKDEKLLTFLCHSLSDIAEYAKVNNTAYKMIRHLIPGPYTFILPASKVVPRYAQNPKRNTSGIRVPDSRICRAIIQEQNSPIISISAKMPDGSEALDNNVLIESLKPLVDYVVTCDEYNFTGESTVLDMTSDSEFEIVREGAGMDKVMEHVDLAA